MLSGRVIDLRRGAIAGQRRAPQTMRPKRSSPLRKKRRRLRVVVAGLLLIVFAAAGYGIHWASYLPQYSVRSILVTGTEEVSPVLVRAYVEARLAPGSRPYLSPDNIFFFNPGSIARGLTDFFPRIASAHISRVSLLATAVTVAVIERKPFARWCRAPDTCYMMDENGFIFAEAPYVASLPATDYVFSGGIGTSTPAVGTYFAPAHLQGFLALFSALGQAGFTPHGAQIEDGQDFSVSLSSGFEVRASFGEDPTQLARDLKLVTLSDAVQGKTTDLEYVDLRFGDRAYFKLKGQDAVVQ